MKSKLFSVIIPTYKGYDSIGVALMSLAKQSYKNIEVLVSDDNGPGTEAQLKTKKIIASFKDKLNIRYLINEHVNGSHARNKGLEKASGEFIAFLDDDDFYLEDYIKDAAEAFEQNKDVDLVFFDVAIITKEGFSRIVSNKTINAKELIFGKKEIGTGSNLCFRRSIYETSGGFDERYLRQQDIEFAAKKLHQFRSLWINEIRIVKYYNHIDNYLNYERSLVMHELLRNDMLKKGIINVDEVDELKNRQLHILYNDMLAKDMDKKGVLYVYNLMKENNSLTLKDKLMNCVYGVSTPLFRLIFRAYLLIVNRKTDKNMGRVYLEYREKLEKA